MFDFAIVHYTTAFLTGTERRVAAVQLHCTAAVARYLNSERQCFHSVLIIQDWELLVNSDSGLALHPKIL